MVTGMIMKPQWLQDFQTQKAELFRAEGFPTRKNEDWKYTNVGVIAENTFRRPPANTSRNDGCGEGRVHTINNARVHCGGDFYQIVILDGQLCRDSSHLPNEKQAMITTWSEQYAADPEWLKTGFSLFSNAKSTPFTLLSEANFDDGLIIKIPDNSIVDKPLHILYITSQADDLIENHLNNLIFIGKNAQASFFEEHHDHNTKHTFHNSLTHIHADICSHLSYFKVSPENEQALQISNLSIIQEQDSRVSTYHFGLGGRLVRDDLHFSLNHSGASCELYGFYGISGKEHYDCHSRIDHASSHTESQQIYKGIIDGKAKGIFNGKVVVHPNISAVSAKQRNNNLLLTKSAEINTKPELIIDSDDVSCSHGATVGDLDPKVLFFLRSRGIPEHEAKQLLTHAFAAEIVQKVPHEKIAAYLTDRIKRKLSVSENTGENRD
jgi:Fe-S cluster assembly protein SufD